MRLLSLLVCILVVGRGMAAVIDFHTAGGIENDDSLDTAQKNGALFNQTLQGLRPGDTLVFPNTTFHVMGGIFATGLRNVTLSFDGTIIYSDSIDHWPRHGAGHTAAVLECFQLDQSEDITITSSGKGLIDGRGKKWWGIPFIGYLERAENRPRLVTITNSKRVLVENIILLDSPYWTFWVPGVDGLEVRHVEISVRRDEADKHTLIDLSAFNTDGFDVTGKNVWIHDCSVWNQDDCVAVKDGSENMLFERINASGLGFTIGSISGSVVRNITFRDCHMHRTMKGIYMKVRGGNDPSLIADVTYENIVIDQPQQYAIWMGPAQQSDTRDLCAAHPCSICWPEDPFAKCEMPVAGTYANITLRNITINDPKGTPGVLLGNSTNPMYNVVFDNVVVNDSGFHPLRRKQYYSCEGIQGVATGSTYPVPSCFKDDTVKNSPFASSGENQ